jgi:hypothetical protein
MGAKACCVTCTVYSVDRELREKPVLLHLYRSSCRCLGTIEPLMPTTLLMK